MRRPPEFTDAEILAHVLKLHNQDRWGAGSLGLRDGPLRRELVKRGLVHNAPRRNLKSKGGGLGNWKLTPAAREMLVNVPGSGIVRREEKVDSSGPQVEICATRTRAGP